MNDVDIIYYIYLYILGFWGWRGWILWDICLIVWWDSMGWPSTTQPRTMQPKYCLTAFHFIIQPEKAGHVPYFINKQLGVGPSWKIKFHIKEIPIESIDLNTNPLRTIFGEKGWNSESPLNQTQLAPISIYLPRNCLQDECTMNARCNKYLYWVLGMSAYLPDWLYIVSDFDHCH